ncbi:hypothetical protein [Burkholderia cenocepacia]|uniref:hypothetical protein n=1 Tax=Burkholderia cenocepacia TaxID=95486 RepID=UPI001F4BBA45|nr:hypothetical protein [Burkholderia cenocepacia]
MKSLIVAIAIALPAVCGAQDADTKLVAGSCESGSHVAEGPVGADLTSRHARYFCDSLAVSQLGDGKLLMQFAEKGAAHGRILGFAGRMDSPATMKVERVYFEPANPVMPNDGVCKFFFNGRQKVTSVMCAAQVDEGNRRTVPVVVFKARSAF